MKHYTSKELTGKTAKQIKIDKVLRELEWEICLQNADFDEQDEKALVFWNSLDSETFKALNPFVPVERIYRVNRQRLGELVQKALEFVDHTTVYKMFDYLIGAGYMKHNPTSQISEHGKIRPTMDTKYELKADLIKNHQVKQTQGNIPLSHFTNSQSVV